MFKLLIASLLGLTAFALAHETPSKDAADDHAAVERAVLDYVEGIYEVKPELIDRGVHPDLTKFGFWRESAEEEYKGMAMTFEELKALAGKWNESGEKANEESPKQVELLDVLDQTAAAKLTAEWGVDYMQLAKFEGEWKIAHVLWQVPPPVR